MRGVHAQDAHTEVLSVLTGSLAPHEAHER